MKLSNVFFILLFGNISSYCLFAQQKPCEKYPIFRQFDFWIGNWRVENPDGTLAGHNKIEVVLDGCTLLENWTGNGSSRGKSFNYYNYQTKRWHQHWVDNFGQTLEFDGVIKDNAVYYTGESKDREGKQVFHKLTISKVNDNEVRQLWEQSYDKEKWSVAFDGKYIRETKRNEQLSPEGQNLEKKLEAYLQPYLKNDLFSGVVLIAKNDKIILQKSYGMANEEWVIPNASNTKFRIASLSKAFTKLAIRQLVEQEKIHKEDPLSKFIPDYPNGEKITIQHLLSHASGIPHINDFSSYDQLAKQEYKLKELIDLFKNQPLEYDPGSKETYSNSGYILLVYIIEQTSRLSYEDYLQKHIFQPAGMWHSGHETYSKILKNKAEGYMQNLSGKGVQKALFYNPSIKIGGGSIYATVEDLFLFDKAFRAGKLSQSTKPLYNQGITGKSPGFNASIWGLDDIFVTVLSNNYSTPIRKIAWDLSNMMLGKKYKIVQINEDKMINTDNLSEYEGNFKIEEDIETIEKVNDVLIEYENGDKWRGCRLIPIGKDTFYDTCYMEKLTFTRNENGHIIGFEWEGGDKTIRINEAIKK